MTRWCLAALAAAAMALAAGCGSSSSTSSSTAPADSTSTAAAAASTAAATTASTEPLVVGVAYAKSGLAAGFDGPAAKAFEAGIDDINANGGVLGRQVKVETADTRSDLNQAKTAGEKLVSGGAEFIVGPCDYDLGSPAALVAEAAGKLSFSLCSGSPKWGVQGIGPHSYSPGVAGAVEGYIAAEWAYKTKGWKTAVALNDTSLSATAEICTGFTQRFKALGGKVLGTPTFQGGTDTVKADSQISEIESKKPDVVMLCTYPPGGPAVMRQMRAAGVDTPVLSNSSMDGDYWLKAVPNLSNFYYVAPASLYGDDSRPAINDFVKRMKATDQPPVNSLNLTGYIVAQLWAEAVKRAGSTDADKVAAELNKFKDVDTILGPVTYTADDHIRLQAQQAIMEIQNGKPKFDELATAEATPPLFIIKK